MDIDQLIQKRTERVEGWGGRREERGREELFEGLL